MEGRLGGRPSLKGKVCTPGDKIITLRRRESRPVEVESLELALDELATRRDDLASRLLLLVARCGSKLDEEEEMTESESLPTPDLEATVPTSGSESSPKRRILKSM